MSQRHFFNNLLEGESLVGSKTLEFKGKERQKLFGADDIHYPEGITIYGMLDEMSEE